MSTPLLYKLTDADGRTGAQYGTPLQWGENVEHTALGGDPCSPDVLHAYRSPLLAALVSPVHVDWWETARCWEADGDVCVEDATKVGCTRLRVLREVPMPQITPEQRVRFGIACAWRGASPEWRAWAQQWLDGTDRTFAAAAASANAAAAAANAAVYAAYANAYAAANANAANANAAAYAANAAAYAAADAAADAADASAAAFAALQRYADWAMTESTEVPS